MTPVNSTASGVSHDPGEFNGEPGFLVPWLRL
jgi:hypothetical protein